MSEPLEALPCLSQSAVASITHTGDIGFLQFGTKKERKQKKKSMLKVLQTETWRDIAALNFHTRRPHKGTSFNLERALGDTTSDNCLAITRFLFVFCCCSCVVVLFFSIEYSDCH